MKVTSVLLALTTGLGVLSGANAALGQVGKGVERLYVLNCGEGVAGDISRWSPGVNVGKSMDFVDNCYLIKHAQGWFLWDTGDAERPGAGRSGSDPLAPFKNARCPTRTAWRQAVGHQGNGGITHS